ncbi:response regulator [Allosphingosinicella deserti]|uniref:Response regulatory domain-containing protein n=1 Tax=Allosphingosinicella deserti TaxID=2116704 RepID=A0A2P7QEH8_9SPHN|nr:response regulator [Sphingomonas deserti]PSJ36335.1 hypothetical protein C7I55_26985 [Sphingomonas deserti]
MPDLRVMVVEDEPLLRMMLADQLGEDAFEVLEAENADVALSILRTSGLELNAVITDVRMPGSMDGLELARRISVTWPHLKVYVTSGHCQAGDLGMPSDATFVPKPYFTKAFSELLKSEFEHGPSRRTGASKSGAYARDARTPSAKRSHTEGEETVSRLLVIEDDDRDLELTLCALQQMQIEVRIDVARDGGEALEYLNRAKFEGCRCGPPSAVMLDLKLPKHGGLDVLAALKGDPTTRSVPVIVLTGSNEHSDRTAAYALGTTGYVVKPLGVAALVNALSEFKAIFGSQVGRGADDSRTPN